MSLINWASNAVCQIERPHLRFQDLCQLAALAEGDQQRALVERACEEAVRPDFGLSWSWRLEHLVALVTAEERRALLEVGLREAQRVGDSSTRHAAARRYAGALPEDELDGLARGCAELLLPGEQVEAHLDLLERAPAARERILDGAVAAICATGPRSWPEPRRAELLARAATSAPPARRRDLVREALDDLRADLAAAPRPPPPELLEDPYAGGDPGRITDDHVARALGWIGRCLPDEWVDEALEIADTLAVPQARAQAVAFLAHLLPLPRRLAVEADLPARPDEPPWLWPDMPDEILRPRLDQWLSLSERARDVGGAVACLLGLMSRERREAVTQWLLERRSELPSSRATEVLLRLIPGLPEPLFDQCLASLHLGTLNNLTALSSAAPYLSAPQLDRAFAAVEAHRSWSSGSAGGARRPAPPARRSPSRRLPPVPSQHAPRTCRDPRRRAPDAWRARAPRGWVGRSGCGHRRCARHPRCRRGVALSPTFRAQAPRRTPPYPSPFTTPSSSSSSLAAARSRSC